MKREAFTLLELIIVIFLLSLLSFFVVGNIKTANIKKKLISIANIKSLAQPNKYSELICLKGCRECFVVDEEFNLQKINGNFVGIKAFILDDTNQLSNLEFGRVDDEKVCFRFLFFPNGSTSEMVIQKGSDFYYIPSFFGEIKKFDSSSSASDYWVRNNYLLRSMGDFY